MMTERARLNSLSSHAAVLARFAARSEADVAEDRERRQRSVALQQKAQDEADLVRLGLAPSPRSRHDVLRDYAAEVDRLDKLEERERAKRAEEQLAARTERVVQLERQLEAERQATRCRQLMPTTSALEVCRVLLHKPASWSDGSHSATAATSTDQRREESRVAARWVFGAARRSDRPGTDPRVRNAAR
jgi:hypothetical protein